MATTELPFPADLSDLLEASALAGGMNVFLMIEEDRIQANFSRQSIQLATHGVWRGEAAKAMSDALLERWGWLLTEFGSRQRVEIEVDGQMRAYEAQGQAGGDWRYKYLMFLPAFEPEPQATAFSLASGASFPFSIAGWLAMKAEQRSLGGATPPAPRVARPRL